LNDTLQVRDACRADSEAITAIYNQGIEDRVATFETRLREPGDIASWFEGRYPCVVVTKGGTVIAFASTSTYRPRTCYDGIAEFSVYVAREARGLGAGRAAMLGLQEAARKAGFYKLISRVFPENTASLRLLDSLGFTEVGVYHRHGRLDGVWRDVVIVEKLLDDENL
jgi:phosphinothricin acetyltransferase